MNIPFLNDFIWQNPAFLWLLALTPLMMIWRGKPGSPNAIPFSRANILLSKTKKINSLWLALFRSLLIFTYFASVCALARPQKIITSETSESQGIAICLCVDVSLSMLIQDFYIGSKPVNRLTAAKKVMYDFIQGRTSDRIGIVAFAGAPYQPCPLTTDTDWLTKNIDRVETGITEDGTAIGSGIAAAARRLDMEKKVPSKVIVLITDGASNSGKLSPQDAAKLASTLKQKIYTISIGTPGIHQIPLPNGNIITSGRQEFDEPTLKEVASIGKGKFFRAQDTAALSEIFKTIDRLEKIDIKHKKHYEYEEYFMIPLLCSLILIGLILFIKTALLKTTPQIALS
jgi:Ca-activated chloride channel family protein